MTDANPGNISVEALAEEFLERKRKGEQPRVAEYLARYPHLAAEICDVFPVLGLVEDFKPRSGEATGSFAEAEIGEQEQTLERLGDFRLLRVIGRGGMGIVYEAVQHSLGRHVALKVLANQALADSSQLARFRLEARAAARLHHTNIVPVFGVGACEGVHYYAMQFIVGQALDVVIDALRALRNGGAPAIERDGEDPGKAAGVDPTLTAIVTQALATGRFGAPPQPEPEPHSPPEPTATTTMADADSAPPPSCPAGSALPDGASELPASVVGFSSELSTTATGAPYYRSIARVGVQVAEALAHAHGRGVLHRDIKPSNVLLDAKGSVWVTDFGLAKAEGSDGLTRTGDIVGTLRYMAPERFDGWSDPRSDVYSLGATLYELLTLRPPFKESNRAKLIEQVLHEEPRPPSKLDRRVPRDLETIVLKALAKEPGQRYTTAEQMAEDLRRFASDRPILARRSSTVERVWRWCKRNPLLAGAGGVVATALVAVATISVIHANKQAGANREITRLAKNLRASLAESNRLLAIRNFDRGQSAFEKDQIGAGLLWMIESWRAAVAATDRDWQHAARANLGAWQPHHARLKAVLSHEGPVDAAAFSPDGKTVLTGGDDGMARLWDAGSGQPVGQPLRHPGTVLTAAFSPDGKSFLTGCSDKLARLWDTTTGQLMGSPLRHDGEVMAVAYSPDGKTIVTGSADNRAQRWDISTGRPVGAPLAHGNSVAAVAYSPDGKFLLTGSHDKTVRRWDAVTGQPIGSPFNHQMPVLAVAYSPDGRTMLTGAGDGLAKQWNMETGSPYSEPIRHGPKVRAVAVSPDGRTMLTASEDKTARLWDRATNQPTCLPLVHQGPVVAVAFSPDGKTFLTCSSDQTVRLWDADPGQPYGLIVDYQNSGRAVAFSRDGKSIASGTWDGMVELWDAMTGRLIWRTMDHQRVIIAMAVSPDGTRLLTGSGDNTARLWDMATGKPVGQTMQHQRSVNVVSFSPDGKMVMTGSVDHTVRFWDAMTGLPLGTHLPQPESVDGGTFSPDGKCFVAGCASGSAQVWDVATRAPRGQPFLHPGCVSAAAFSPDGRTLLTGCEDGGARLWNVETHRLLTAPLLHQAWVYGVAFSHDGTTVLTGIKDGTARLWDAATGMPLGPTIPRPASARAALTVCFSPDDAYFATGYSDKSARVFRKTPELPDDLVRVETWVGLLTGLWLDAEKGAIQALDNAAWRRHRDRLEQLGGPPDAGGGPRLDPFPLATDPLARVRALMQRGEWDQAEVAVDELVRARPYNIAIVEERGDMYARRGLCREAVRLWADASAADPKDTLLSLRVASLQAWFGQEKDLAATRQRIRTFAKDTKDWAVAERAAKVCSIVPCTDKVQLEAALALARAATLLVPDSDWNLLALGMAEYRSGNDAAALEALTAAERAGPNVTVTSAFYRAMSLFRQGKKEQARKVAIAAAAKMRPLPKDEQNPLAGGANENDLILWLAYKEAQAMIQFDAGTRPNAQPARRK